LPPFSADGWRVDVANMLGRQGETQLGQELGQAIRRAVRQARPDAFLMGENFFDATDQLQGDQWDGVMNYDGFTHPLWHWLRGYEQGAHGLADPLRGPRWSSETMVTAWRSRLAAIPWVVACRQYNLLDSHDTPRIRTIVGGNDALHRLAVALLLTFPGVPGLYYGDEIGLTDLPHVQQRGCMVWDEARWNKPLRDYHRQLIHLRRESVALRQGGFQVLLTEADTIAYQRDSATERVLVFAHRSQQPRPAGDLPLAHAGVPDGTRFVDVLGGAEVCVREGRLPLPEVAQGALILRQVG
jgi:alpha-glucosidase